MSYEEIAMSLIANSGEARSLAFKAVKAARTGDFELAESFLEQADSSSIEAHKSQMELLTKEANGDVNVTMLMVHAQDHLMTSLLAQDLIREIVYLYEAKNK